MAIALSTEIREMVDHANFAHLATLLSDGSPHSDPVWIAREADRIVVCTSENTVKAKNTRRDPRVAISIVDFDDPYTQLAGEGLNEGNRAMYEHQLRETSEVCVRGKHRSEAHEK